MDTERQTGGREDRRKDCKAHRQGRDTCKQQQKTEREASRQADDHTERLAEGQRAV